MATGKAKLAPPENPHVGRKFVSPVPSSSAARQRAPEPDPEFQKRLDALGNKWAAERPAREEKKAIETQTRLAEESAAAVGAGGADIAERLAQLVQMKEAGHLTPEEFEDAKRQALGNKQFENTSEVAEQVEFDVILESSGRKKLQVIQTVRQLTVLGLREAKDLVEGAPNPVLQGVSEESAWMAKEALEGVGATVTIS